MIKYQAKLRLGVQMTCGLWGCVMVSHVLEHMTKTAAVTRNQEVGS